MKQETIDRIYYEVSLMTIEHMKNSRELLTKYGYMNSPEDNVKLDAINERLSK